MILYLFINKIINLIIVFKRVNDKFLDIDPYTKNRKLQFYVHISVFLTKLTCLI